MTLASNKYKTLVEAGQWMAMSDDQAKILALEAKFNKLGTRPPSKDGKPPPKSPKRHNGKVPKQGKGKKPLPDWMKKWPGHDFVNNNKSKVVEGKTYWWCKKHKRFCMHKTNECRLTATSPPGNNQDRGNGGGNPPANNSTPSIRVTTATMMDE